MPKEKRTKQPKMLCVDDLRHAEYYGMQQVFDDLYARSQKGEVFTDLMDLILSRENILLAYRNIKTNAGSDTPGTDKITIEDIGRMTPDEVVAKVNFIVAGSKHGYRSKPVRRKDIPKPNGSTRPLGIPCMWDRLVQQCIKQVMEPICEAKFTEDSFGFRPNRSVENAIQRTYCMLQRSHLYYVVEVDIKGFFDNVNHPKLMRQIWALGIRDKHLIYVLKQILKAPIRMTDGSTVIPEKGTPQGGILSPLLANIVLNELDHWIDSQWHNNPVSNNFTTHYHDNGSEIKSNAYAAMKKTRLKEMYLVRYADDFRIFCRNKESADRTLIAVTQWLSERLKLEVSPEKTKVVNVKQRYCDFLGFKIKVHKKGDKQVVTSRVSDKALQSAKQKFSTQAKRIARPRPEFQESGETRLYNSMVMGWQNYFAIATDVSVDAAILHRMVMTIFTNRLHEARLKKKGRQLTEFERKRYGNSEMLRFAAESKEPIYPIGYTQHRIPMAKKRKICSYTPEGRKGLHENLRINVLLMHQLMQQPLFGRSAEYADNRISLFSAQWGICAITGKPFMTIDEIHCHHKTPRAKGGTDKYDSLVLVSDQVHRLIHATNQETIRYYLNLLTLDKKQLAKVNDLRVRAGLVEIAA